ncbi:uncharacterized protein LOC117100434 isoform X3 [Anneissia japonica]|uniref:uncharacterized protein LOC117100434 isoform X3 n=1 Tax=Anneissia japonica TaxID=1529436 RepID=UPI001425A1D6|nr:uncharacterized protein LOC117100434 isoform X3 [Anneissia japonica]
MALNWRKKEYFQLLISGGEDAHAALELLVDDLHKDKPRTVTSFLDHCGSEDFLWGLVYMLRHKNTRVAGNSAYILGTLAEHHLGQARILALISGQHPHTILADLSNMLDYDDSESVMNAAGTLGTLAETAEGREWMLKEQCITSTVSKVMMLLSSENMWTASNAALVLARLSISEDGCHLLLCHQQSQELLTQLIQSLGVDEAGKGMNAAFAVGRICDTEEGRQKLIQHQDISKMISSLSNMLSSKDPGCGKNSCFAVSCLAGNKDGLALLLGHQCCDVMLRRLAEQLDSKDVETSWFAAMTLRTLASQKKGCVVLRDHSIIVPALKQINSKTELSQDLRDEVELTLELLKKLEKPNPPTLEVKGPKEIMLTWDTVTLKSGLDVIYKLYLDSTVLYKGANTSFLATNLKPNHLYYLKLQLTTDGDESPLSDVVEVATEECAPDAPEALRILAVSTSQIRIGWSPPALINGGLKGYVVYNGKQQVEVTTELCCTLSALAPSTKYDIYVCAFNHKGKGPKAWISAATGELGKHAPGKPILNVRGRNEIHLTWLPPEFPLGRLHKFEITLNGKVVYSGTDLSFTARRLVPNTEYTFKVVAVTSEGRCESEPAKKKTLKDEYNVQSTAPIFFSHPHKSTDQDAASRQVKQQSQLLSKGNRIKTPSSQKQRNAHSSPSESTESRPSSGYSLKDQSLDSTVYSSSDSDVRTRSSSQRDMYSTSLTLDSKSSSAVPGGNHLPDGEINQNHVLHYSIDGTKNTPHGDNSSDNCNPKSTHYQGCEITSDSDESVEDDEPQSEWKVVIRNKYEAENSVKKSPAVDMSGDAQSCGEPTARIHDSWNEKTGEPHDEVKHMNRQSREQGTKLRSKHKFNKYTPARGTITGLQSILKETTLSDNCGGRNSLTNKEPKSMEPIEETGQNNGKNYGKLKTETDMQEQDMQKVSVASVKDRPVDGIHHRERQPTFPIKHRQFTDVDIKLRKQELGGSITSKKYRTFRGNQQVKKLTRLQSSSISHDSNLQGIVNRRGSYSSSRYSPTMMSGSRFRSETNLSSLDKMPSDTQENVDTNGFVLSANGTIIYTEGEPQNPKSKGKNCTVEQPIREEMALEEGKYLSGNLFKGKEPLSKKTPNLFPWERDGVQFQELPYERYTELDNQKQKNLATLQKTYSKPMNFNTIVDPLHDKHCNSDRTVFYQRAQTFMSSHRPLLKKTLEKLPSHVPGTGQSGGTSTGTMECNLPQPLNNNRYQFIPMQFRTQPLHMPGSPLHPGNPNGNLYDKVWELEEVEQRPSLPRSYTCPSLEPLESPVLPPINTAPECAYVRKLEAMSYLSSQKMQSALPLQPCRPPVMRYSHRESPTLQVDSPKSRSTSGLLTDAAR